MLEVVSVGPFPKSSSWRVALLWLLLFSDLFLLKIIKRCKNIFKRFRYINCPCTCTFKAIGRNQIPLKSKQRSESSLQITKRKSLNPQQNFTQYKENYQSIRYSPEQHEHNRWVQDLTRSRASFLIIWSHRGNQCIAYLRYNNTVTRTTGIRSINSTTGTAITTALTESESLVLSVAPASLVKMKVHKTMLIS